MRRPVEVTKSRRDYDALTTLAGALRLHLMLDGLAALTLATAVFCELHNAGLRLVEADRG